MKHINMVVSWYPHVQDGMPGLREKHTHSLVCWMMALNSIFGSITSIPFMPQIMMLSCCLCNLARAAGQSTACPKLYNLQPLGKLNPQLWGCDDSEDAKTMRSRWKNTHLRPSWMIYHVCPFELSTISICSQHWCQCHSLCDHSIPVPVDLLAAKCLSTLPRPFLHPTHVRHLGRVAAANACILCQWWFGWCATLCGAVTSIVSGLLQLISTSRCGHMIWYVCTGHGEPRFRALSLSITPRPLK